MMEVQTCNGLQLFSFFFATKVTEEFAYTVMHMY